MLNRRNFIKTAIFAAVGTLFTGSMLPFRSARLQLTREQIRVSGVNSSLRIVAASDIHGRCDYLPLTDLVGVINKLQPDVFILGGDIVEKRQDLNLIAAYKSIIVKHATLAVMGNWEHKLDHSAGVLKKRYHNIGARLLINEIYHIHGYDFVGIDDYLFGRPDFRLVNEAFTGEHPVVVISHCPAVFDHFASTRNTPVIVISGHTHGGQIAPFGKAFITPAGSGSYIQGWYRCNKASMYVMRGIGTSVLPIRIGAPPELLVLDLLPAV